MDLANAPYSRIRIVTFWVWVWLVTKVPGAGLPVGIMMLLRVQLPGTIGSKVEVGEGEAPRLGV